MRHVSFDWKENKRWPSEEVQDERTESFQVFLPLTWNLAGLIKKEQNEYDRNDKILFLFLFTDSYMTFNINNM